MYCMPIDQNSNTTGTIISLTRARVLIVPLLLITGIVVGL
jgi:hypothetical protein